jgi:hypothetical protein
MIKPLTTELCAPLWNDLPGCEPSSVNDAVLPLRLPQLTVSLTAANTNGTDSADDADAYDQLPNG